MKKGWESKKLGDVCSFLNRGISPKYLDDGGICVLNQKCIRDHRVNFSQARRHDINSKVINSERYIQLGDVLVNSTGTGTLGRVAQIRETPIESTITDSHVTIVRPKPGMFFNDFFGYTLINIEELIKEAGEGCGGQTELSRSVLAEKFSVNYPKSLDEQQRIVSILDNAFADIATAKANAEKNLQNARTLFESHLQSVFTKRGKGWVEKRVGELVADGVLIKPFDGNHGEIHPNRADFIESGVPFIMASDLKNGKVDTANCKFISRKLAESLRVGFAKDSDVLVSHKGTIGRSAILTTNDDYIILTPQVTSYRIKDQNQLYNRFIRYFFMSPGFQQEFIKGAEGGATRAYIGITKQLDLRFRFPSLEEQKTIAEKLDLLIIETQHLESIYQQKLAALDALKKSLLNQAFTGQL